MEARAFGAPTRRTWARASRIGARDGVLVLICAGIGATAITLSVLTGSWNFIAA
jgi:energy-coupling factor transport system permease protein